MIGRLMSRWSKKPVPESWKQYYGGIPHLLETKLPHTVSVLEPEDVILLQFDTIDVAVKVVDVNDRGWHE